MGTFLFNEVIFGPVKSRRLGVSLGINLLPGDKKFCNFDCLYCECGFTCNTLASESAMPPRDSVSILLRSKINDMKDNPDVITFAGNGEPTIHPEFPGIIDDTIQIRDKLCPEARIAVLSNSTTLSKKTVLSALKKVDQPILKLDTAIQESYRLINRPAGLSKVSEIIDQLAAFPNGPVIQTLFFKGKYQGRTVDNTSEKELEELFKAYTQILPEKIMIYTFERDTPIQSLEKVSKEKLEEIGERIRELGFKAEISA